jgi:hypothetical protein
MCELSRLLSALKIDGRPVQGEHVVLISESESAAPRDWVVSILGVRSSDLDRVMACRAFSATDTEGERYAGRVRVAPGSSSWHVRLEGCGVLRHLRPVEGRSGGVDGEADVRELAPSPRRRHEA